jgi:VanZ family protein
MSFIFYLSSQAQLPGPEVVPAQSYLEHLVAYAILGALLQRAFHSRSAAAGIIWGSLYGVSDELHQHFVPPRTASAADLLTDVIGVVCGALLFARLRRQD